MAGKPEIEVRNPRGRRVCEEWDIDHDAAWRDKGRVVTLQAINHETAKWLAECIRAWYQTQAPEDPPDRIVVD